MKYLALVASAAALATALSGCAGALSVPGINVSGSAATAPTGDAIAKLAAFTLTDLENADSDAIAHNDQIAHACYPALERFVTELQGNNLNATVSGAFGVFQRTRDFANQASAGLPQYLVIGCAPLFVDANAMIARMALLGAVAAPK